MSLKDRVDALECIVGVTAIAAVDQDLKFRRNLLDGLAEFSKISEAGGREAEASAMRTFARRFAAASSDLDGSLQ